MKKYTDKTAQPNIILKGNQVFRHDVYEGSVEKTKKNISYKKYQPQIVEIEHKHWFHSYDSRGKKLNRTSASNGHYHYIEEYVDENGELKLKCGPAMRTVDKRLRNGMTKKVEEKVAFQTIDQDKTIEDNHIHEFTYKFSEKLTTRMIEEYKKMNQQQIESLTGPITEKQVKNTTPAPLNKADGVEIHGV